MEESQETKSDTENRQILQETERPTTGVQVVDAEDNENSTLYESTLSDAMTNDDSIVNLPQVLTSNVVEKTETTELVKLDNTAAKRKISGEVYKIAPYSDEIVADPDETVELMSCHEDTVDYTLSTSTDDTAMAPITELNCVADGCRNFRTCSVIFLIVILILTIVGRFAIKGILETSNIDKDSLEDISSGVDNVFAIICTPIAGILVCFLVNYITCRCRRLKEKEARLRISAVL